MLLEYSGEEFKNSQQGIEVEWYTLKGGTAK